MPTIKDLYNKRLAELFESAETHIQDFIYDEAKAAPLLVKLCYEILAVKDLRTIALETAETLQNNEDKPARGITPPPAKEIPKAAMQAFSDTPAPMTQPYTPKSAPKKETNQKFIDVKWETYFDGPWLDVFIRRVVSKSTKQVNEYYSVYSKNGLKMDVAFKYKKDFENIQHQTASIIPGEFLIQPDAKGFAKIYIVSIVRHDGEPIRVVEQ